MIFGSVSAQDSLVDLLRRGCVGSQLFKKCWLPVTQLMKGCSEVDEHILEHFRVKDALIRWARVVIALCCLIATTCLCPEFLEWHAHRIWAMS